jgi:hypothetical protein
MHCAGVFVGSAASDSENPQARQPLGVAIDIQVQNIE